MKDFPSKTIKKLLVDLIRFPTINPPGTTHEIVTYLKEWFDSFDMDSEVITHTKNSVILHNIIARLGHGEKKIIFSGHLDVVPAGDPNQWMHNDPFSGIESNGNIYGRGSADMKGGVASSLAVMLMLRDEKDLLSKYQLIFAGTADEEAGMTGAMALRDHGIMNDAYCLIIPEATNRDVGIAEKGIIWAEITVHGKAAHGSMPEEGINAIEETINLYRLLHNLLDPNLKNPSLGLSTMNIGTIRGGSKVNIVPDTCIIEIDYRVIPEGYNNFKNKLKNELEKTNINYSLSFKHDVKPIQSDANHPFVQNLSRITGSKTRGLAYATDGAIFIDNTHSPIPFVIYGPGNSQIIHKVDEYVPFNDLKHIAETTAEAILTSFT